MLIAPTPRMTRTRRFNKRKKARACHDVRQARAFRFRLTYPEPGALNTRPSRLTHLRCLTVPIPRRHQRIVVPLPRPIPRHQLAIRPAPLRQKLPPRSRRPNIKRSPLPRILIDNKRRRPLIGSQQSRSNRPKPAIAQNRQPLGMRKIRILPTLQIPSIGPHIRLRRIR